MLTLYKFGKDKTSGETVFIQDTANGLLCDCVCFDCGRPFIAAQGDKNKWHFRHSEVTDCKGGQETALHKLAKKIIVESNEIVLPKYGTVTYTNAAQEKYFQSIIPDVTATINGQNIFFEVLVTHAVDKPKEDFYKTGGYKSIEIDLKGYFFTTFENLRNEILKGLERKKIIFWEKETGKQSNIEKWIIGIFIAILTYVGIKALCNMLKRRNRN